VAAAALLVVPWVVRNSVALETGPVLATNTGYNLRIGHASYATGGFATPVDLYRDQGDRSWQERELMYNDAGTSRALRYAVRHPVREVELSGRKVMWLWRSDTQALDWVAPGAHLGRARDPVRFIIDGSYFVLLVFAAIGLRFRPPRGVVDLVVLTVGSWTLFHIVFFGYPRFHVPVLVVLIPIAVYGAACIAASSEPDGSGARAQQE
jgi:hypothetical protein